VGLISGLTQRLEKKILSLCQGSKLGLPVYQSIARHLEYEYKFLVRNYSIF
jgi:hypothetical protein